MPRLILAIDQGTTSSRAILFDQNGAVLSQDSRPTRLFYPKQGWVEQDGEEIFSSVSAAVDDCLAAGGISPADIAAIGITNQRETALIWEKASGKPIAPAINWQCRRTAPRCEELKAQGLEDTIRQKTGLVTDPYFSATKYQWILDSVPGSRLRAMKGELLCGTVESWLIWKLTGNHVSDVSNCSRTMLFDIHRLQWDEELCRLFDIPLPMLPSPVPNAGTYGSVQAGPLAGIPICGAAGDQQAALFGQGCHQPGQAKNTYGTGCFTLMNVGDKPLMDENGLLTSVAWQLGDQVSYALEGSVFHAGSAIQWLRDELKLISSAQECTDLALTVPDNGGVYLVSAFTGLGAPHWDPYARGAILGLTRNAGRAHLCRAALEGIAFQVADLMDDMTRATGRSVIELRVDGGASVSDFMMQFQADITDIEVHRPAMVETTALGAAYLAGLGCGLWKAPGDFLTDRHETVFRPTMQHEAVARLRGEWNAAVARITS